MKTRPHSTHVTFPLAVRLLLALLLATAGLPGRQPPAPTLAAAPPGAALAQVSPWLLAAVADGSRAEFLVVLHEQADLSGAALLSTKAEKGRYVFDALRRTAQSSQPGLLRWLEARGVSHRAFYIVNAVWASGDADLVAALAARPDVARIDANPRLLNALAAAVPAGPNSPVTPYDVEPGIAFTGAPEVWLMGFTGQGVVVGGQDTGYDWRHPALINQYRGWDGQNANHDYNWHDAIHSGGGSCGADSPVPCDDGAHGTHTLGTAIGSDGGQNQIGMAPGAKWIGCRNMDEGEGTPATYLECFEFFLAPYPVGGDPAADGDPLLAPDVTNNSWGCPPFEGCEVNTLLQAADVQRAAGILTVGSAGNSGPTCESISDPPPVYDSVYAVGALVTGSDNIANFSSRGPVTEDGSGRSKPDLTAPGTNIRSAVPGESYNAGFSGTSMAAPHVAGAVALLWSAVPELKDDIDRTLEILNQAAVPIATSDCSSSGSPNHVYGYGRLDIKAAVDLAMAPGSGTTAGTVTNAETGEPIPGAQVFLTHNPPPTYTATADQDGAYVVLAPEGSYLLVAFAPRFIPEFITDVQVTAGVTTSVDVALRPAFLYFWPAVWFAGGVEHGRQIVQGRAEG